MFSYFKTCSQLIIFLVFNLSLLNAQTPFGSIKYLGVEDGLSNNAVNSLYLDHFGFMWMGTYDGLNRYDGYGFKIFRNDWADKSNLVNNHITVLNGDRQNRVWVGTQKGVSYYDYADSKFHQLAFQENKKRSEVSYATNAITIAPQQVYFATDEKGLFVLKNRQKFAQRIFFKGSGDFSVKAMCTDGKKFLWLFIKDAGLCLLNTETNTIKPIRTDIRSVTSMVKGIGEEIWIGTERGLYRYHSSEKTLEKCHQLSGNENIMSLMLDSRQKLWLATDGGGIIVYDIKTEAVSYLPAGREKGLLSSNAVAQVYEDHESRKWIATLRGGVNLIDPEQSQFKTIRHNPLKSNSLINNFTLSFGEDQYHNIWIGTDGSGLSVWNRQKDTFTNYAKNGQPGALSSNFVTSILNDADNQIWVATFSGGIDRFDPATSRFIHYPCYDPVKKADEENLWKLYQDKEQNIWAGSTKGGSLYRYNKTLDKFECFDHRLKDIHALFQDSKGRLWAGNYSQIIRIDPEGKKHDYVNINSAIRAIQEADGNRIWIGTEGGGLLLFDPETKRFKRYLEGNGLPSNAILNILKDKAGNLWSSTYNGLSRFDVKHNTFKNYFANDGLQSNQFNYNAALKLSNGDFLFGGIGGFNLFSPDSIRKNRRIPKIVLTDFKVNNISIDQDSTYQHTSLVNLDKISIPYQSAVISVHYAAIEFSFQDQISYAYYLEGWDRNWNYVNKLSTAYYSRLDEGTYNLHIKSTDTEGVWSNNEKVVTLVILPPWYRTWWAYAIYLLMGLALFYLFQIYRNRQRRLKHEIESTNLEMEREKDLNEKKLNFFTNISHELRTPLTLIVNPIKDILNQKESGPEKSNLNVVYRNSKRLLSLVDQLLLFRKTESENDTLNMVKINLCSFAREIFLCFNYLAQQNNICYTFACEEKELYIYGDRDKIEIVLFNLLSNALKFTPKGGFVKLGIHAMEGIVKIEVSDSGPGIPEHVGEKLFDKFYKVMSNESLKMGFGIGLYLAKNFVELHQGKIAFTSVPGAGTVFSIELPVAEFRANEAEVTPQNELTYVNELIAEQKEEEEKKGDDSIGNLELLISDLHTILIVDDNTEIIDYIRQIFKENFRIYTAIDGLEGFRLSKEYLPDIVISDVNMGGLNGMELCQAMKEDAALSHIPVILLTADPSQEIKLKGFEVGAYDFISKPFDKELFTAKINGIIKNRINLQSYFFNEITLKSDAHKVSQEDKGFLQKCITLIEDNLMESSFNVKTLAAGLGMSHSNLYKKIKSTSGQSINSFIRFIRLRKAAELLINTNLNINEAAFRVGINDTKYFREHFQKLFKLTPSEFIKKHRKSFHKYYNINATV